MDLFAGKDMMESGITAEMLEELTGDIISKEKRAEFARRDMLQSIVMDDEAHPNLRMRASRGFMNRKEERDAKKSVKAQIRRYHRIVDGEMFAKIEKRRIKKKRGNQARKANR